MQVMSKETSGSDKYTQYFMLSPQIHMNIIKNMQTILIINPCMQTLAEKIFFASIFLIKVFFGNTFQEKISVPL